MQAHMRVMDGLSQIAVKLPYTITVASSSLPFPNLRRTIDQESFILTYSLLLDTFSFRLRW